MNELASRLPWRLGALGGLLVGAISLAGGADLWICLMRTGIAFLVFGGLGVGLRALLEAGMPGSSPRQPAPRKEADARSAGTGTHIDQKTPPMTAGDLPPPEE